MSEKRFIVNPVVLLAGTFFAVVFQAQFSISCRTATSFSSVQNTAVVSPKPEYSKIVICRSRSFTFLMYFQNSRCLVLVPAIKPVAAVVRVLPFSLPIRTVDAGTPTLKTAASVPDG